MTFILFRLSSCDLLDFNVEGIWVCWLTGWTPRMDCVGGRDDWELFDVGGILSLIVTWEVFEGFGLYKQDGSISLPRKRNKKIFLSNAIFHLT